MAKADKGKSGASRTREAPPANKSHASTTTHLTGPTIGIQHVVESGLSDSRLAISRPTDPSEVAAERVAEKILAEPSPPSCPPAAPQLPGDSGTSGTRLARKAIPKARVTDPFIDGLGAGRPLEPDARTFLEPRFDRDLSGVRLHTGPSVRGAAASVGAEAFTVGADIAVGEGAPNLNSPAGQRLLAHELAHVVQQQGNTPAIRRVGAADPPFGYTKAERDIIQHEQEAKRAAEARTVAWRGTVAAQAPKDLKSQSSNLQTDVERSALAVIASRSNVLTRLSARLPTGFADDWAAARTSVELVKAALEPDDKGNVPTSVPVDVQDYVRERLAAFYVSLRSWEVTRYNDAVAAAHNHYQVWRMNQMMIAGTRFADRSPPKDTVPPPAPTMDVRNRSAAVNRAERPDAWKASLADFDRSTALVDEWSKEMLPKDSPERQALEQAVGLHERQEELLRTRPDALKIPAVFYPKDEMAKPSADDKSAAPAAAGPQAVGYPWFFYLYRKGPDWYLEDLTAPDKRVNVREQSAGEGFASFAGDRFHWPKKVDPPEDLWEQLNSKLRFPEGELHITLPSGGPYTLVTTAPTSLSEYLGYAAMAVAAVTLVLFTAGAGTPAAIALVAGAGLGIASTVAGLSELEEQGMATSGDRARAALMIAVDLASVFTMGLGRVAAGVAKAGETASLAARLAGRLFVPVARLSVALDITQLYVMTDQFVEQYRAIANQPGLTDEQRKNGQTKIILIGLASGALSLWSTRSTLREVAAHGTISTDELLPSTGATAPRGQVLGPPSAAASAPRTADFRLGRATLVEGAQLVDTLAPGTVHVELRRNRWGLVSEVAVVHGPPPASGAKAFAADIAHHQQIAKIALDYSGLLGEIRELLEKLAAAFAGRSRGPLEKELELAKLEGRIQDRLERLSDPKGVSAGERAAYLRDLESFRNQIKGHREAIARGDKSTGRIAQQGTPAGHPVAPPGHTYHYDTVRQRWDIVADVAGGPRLRVEIDPTTQLPTGRFSNMEQLDTLHVTGVSVSDPTALQRLAAVGYAVGPGDVIVPGPTVSATTAASMVPLRVVNGKVEVTPHVRLDAASLGPSAWYKQFRGKTLDTESMVALHGETRPVWQTEFTPVTASLGRGGAETQWRRASLYGLIDYIRYHILGPGTGLERMRIFLAPEVANQFANNHIEGYMRRIRDSGKASVSFRVNYQSFTGSELRSFIDTMLTSGDQKLMQLLARDQGRFERLLKSARYDIRIVDKQGKETLYQASVLIGTPGPSRKGSVTVSPPTQVPPGTF